MSLFDTHAAYAAPGRFFMPQMDLFAEYSQPSLSHARHVSSFQAPTLDLSLPSGNHGGMDTLARPRPKPRAVRASSSRSKKGCTTCRKRHVKCDETKPSCQRCLKWQGHCSGYGSPPPTTAKTSPEPLDGAERSDASDDDRMLTESLLDPQLFADQAETTYFQSWVQLASVLGGRTFTSPDAYLRIISQPDQGPLSLRYAAIAIGALRMAIGASDLPRASLGSQSEEFGKRPHAQNALSYYNLAIRELATKSPVDSDDDMREAIHCSLLFTCYEMLEGRFNRAVRHIHHGVTMIDQLLKVHGYEEFINILLSELPPAHQIIDHEVFRIYRMLDAQSWAYVCFHPWPCSLARWKERANRITLGRQLAPVRFADLDEARHWLHVAEQVCHYYSRLTWSAFIHGTEEGRDMAGYVAVDTRADCLSQLTLWYEAFQPLYAEMLKLPPNSDPYLRAIALRAGYVVTYVSVRCPVLSDATEVQSIHSQCRELLRLASILLENDREVFTMDIGPVRTLLVTFLSAADPGIRQDALRLLKKARRREGLWDSRDCINIGTRCAELVDDADLLLHADSPNVVRVRGYKQNVLGSPSSWRYVETTLKLLEKEPTRDDCWDELEGGGYGCGISLAGEQLLQLQDQQQQQNQPRKKRGRGAPRKLYIGIQLQQLPSTTGRWLLYEGGEME